MSDPTMTPARTHPKPIRIMGILNVTPDSFSDGGRFAECAHAVGHALTMIAEGADIIDVGPESTRPGSQPVSAKEQIRRAIPVIETIRATNDSIALSIDTQSAEVAAAALDVGANIVNDISALRGDPQMTALVASRQPRVILMHMQGTPATMQERPTYRDVVAESIAFLKERAQFAQRAGIESKNIIVDPGIGFGKTTAHNLEIMRGLDEYQSLGVDVLIGASRKRFLNEITPGETEPNQRLSASLACIARALQSGTQIVRVHDVVETRQFVAAFQAMNSYHRSPKTPIN